MALDPGTWLGPYQIESPLGAGGMGEVYKARDTRLDRTVAIKVLPEHVANNPELKQRFEREAKTVAGLSHPNICPVFDVGEQDGLNFLVMEYLDGETLAQRLKKGALPLDRALTIAIEIADALDRAHRQGIVHRDLKPANIMLTKAGAKLLDFGLAKPTGMAMGTDSAMPTMSAGLTAEGAILGTLQYMAPEQLEGDVVDARTDIFAFGTTVYEMITGAKTFSGKSQASLIGSILKDEPRALTELQPVSPPALDRVVKKCLAKDPERRWHSAHDLHDELKWVAEAGAVVSATSAPSRSAGRRHVALLVGSAVVASAVVGLAVWGLTRSSPPLSTRFVVTSPTGVRMIPGFGLAVSPDGRTVVFVGRVENIGNQLYQRSLGEVDSVLIAGTQQPWIPFFSPDGEWVGYIDQSDNTLRKVRLDSGSNPVTLTQVPTGSSWRSASWGADDQILFGSQDIEGLWRISANGGEPERIELAESDEAPRWLDLLPDSQAALATSGRLPSTEIVVLDLTTGEQTTLLVGASPRYVSTGHIVYWREESLWAVPFDAERREITGSPVPVVENVQVNVIANGLADYAVGGHSLVYGPGGGTTERQLVWVDRNGQEDPLGAPLRAYDHPRVSPDGTQVAVSINDDGNTDIWIYDIARGTSTRLTFDPAADQSPLWTPDGQRVVFGSTRDGDTNMYWRAADGTGPVERLTTSPRGQIPNGWTSDGRQLVFMEQAPETNSDIWLLPIDGDSTPEPIVVEPFSQTHPTISPDGQWVAYMSNASGDREIYVQPFPGLDGRWQISTTGGVEPLWSPTGTELFFRQRAGVMTVPINTSDGFAPGNPESLFSSAYFGGSPIRQYDLHPDGERFLMVKLQAAPVDSGLVVVENWLDQLTALVPVGQ